MKQKMISMLMLVLLSTTTWAAAPLKLDIEGSTTVGPIINGFVEIFEKKYPDAQLTVKTPGSSMGAKALIEGRCDIAMMSRFMKTEEFEIAVEKGVYPVAHMIAMDGICFVVHPTNPVRDLKIGQLKDIYQGKITNWKELGGADMEIVAISRDTGSGTYETFHNLVMNKDKLGNGVDFVNGNPHAQNRVRHTPGAIAYVGLGFLEGVKPLQVNGIEANEKTIASGVYPIARPLFLFTNGYPKLGSIAHEFCSFYLKERGQRVISEVDFIPVTDY